MLRTGQLDQTAFLKQKLQDARTCSKRYLSIVEKAINIHPLSVYHFYKKLNVSERFYWSNQENTTILTGIGSLVPYHHSTEGQYSAIKKEWEHFCDEVYREKVDKWGTGPILMGGFSFFDEYRNIGHWEKFGTAHFYVPKLMLTISMGETYITTNYEITDSTTEADLEKQYEEYHSYLEKYGMTQPEFEENILQSKEEYQPLEWTQSVGQAIDKMKGNQLDKVVLNRTMQATFTNDINSTKVIYSLEATRNVNYIFSYQLDDHVFISATPERLIQKKDNCVYSMCLAGSAGKGLTVEENEKNGKWLINDLKNRHEHDFVVKYIKNTLKSFCEELNIPMYPRIMATKSLLHLFTPVEGVLHQHVSLIDLVKALHPTPALGGFPKKEACQLIAELEPLERGWYGAPFGWIDANGNGDFAVGIRSALIKQNEAKLFAGCGVVESSNPEEEYKETGIKFLPMLNALGGSKNETK